MYSVSRVVLLPLSCVGVHCGEHKLTRQASSPSAPVPLLQSHARVILTGRYPWRITSTLCDNDVCNYLPATRPMGTHLGYSMLPERLAEVGYTSFHVGK